MDVDGRDQRRTRSDGAEITVAVHAQRENGFGVQRQLGVDNVVVAAVMIRHEGFGALLQPNDRPRFNSRVAMQQRDIFPGKTEPFMPKGPPTWLVMTRILSLDTPMAAADCCASRTRPGSA